jgi:hypothetical protein
MELDDDAKLAQRKTSGTLVKALLPTLSLALYRQVHGKRRIEEFNAERLWELCREDTYVNPTLDL